MKKMARHISAEDIKLLFEYWSKEDPELGETIQKEIERTRKYTDDSEDSDVFVRNVFYQLIESNFVSVDEAEKTLMEIKGASTEKNPSRFFRSDVDPDNLSHEDLHPQHINHYDDDFDARDHLSFASAGVQKLLKMAAELENPNHETLIAAEEDEELLNRVAMSFAKAAEALRDAAGTIAVFEPIIDINEQKLDEIAAVAKAFDESGDELLQKQASVLDEVLMLFGSPNGMSLIKKSKAEVADALKNKDMWMESKAVKDAVEVIKASPVYKQYRPLETGLSSRTCPEHHTPMARIADNEYQCVLDNKIYNYSEGYTDMHKNVVPGTVVQNQNVYDEARFSYSSTEDSRLDRMGLKNG